MKQKIDRFVYLALWLVIAIFSSSFIEQGNSLEIKEEWLEEAYVTFATSDYFPILEVLVDSVQAFSSRPIIVFGVNADVPFSQEKYPMMIPRRIDVDLTKESIYYQKPKIILESQVRYGVYVEADDILNAGSDYLFEMAKTISAFPLSPRHPQDPNNQIQVMQVLGVKRKSMPYVHGHVIFSEQCLPFVQEWYNTCIDLGNIGANYDETILNVLLWKYRVKKFTEVYDPYYTVVEDFFDGTKRVQVKEGYSRMLKINYLMFHGCKDPLAAHHLLERLIQFQHYTGRG